MATASYSSPVPISSASISEGPVRLPAILSVSSERPCTNHRGAGARLGGAGAAPLPPPQPPVIIVSMPSHDEMTGGAGLRRTSVMSWQYSMREGSWPGWARMPFKACHCAPSRSQAPGGLLCWVLLFLSHLSVMHAGAALAAWRCGWHRVPRWGALLLLAFALGRAVPVALGQCHGLAGKTSTGCALPTRLRHRRRCCAGSWAFTCSAPNSSAYRSWLFQAPGSSS